MRLSIVVITWNGLLHIQECLNSISEVIDYNRDEVVVVDNGSNDGTVEWVQINHPQVRLLELDKNIGVAPARNKGIWLAKGDYIMVLDNDTRYISQISPGDVIESYFREHADVGLFSFILKNPDGTFQRNVRRFPDVLQPFVARISVLRKLAFFNRCHRRHLMDDVNLEEMTVPFDVDYVLGANQIFRKETAVLLGGYDEHMFNGPEDCDFCLRVRRQGLRVQYLPAAEIIHDYQRRTRGFNLKTLKHIYYFYYFFFKNKSLYKISV